MQRRSEKPHGISYAIESGHKKDEIVEKILLRIRREPRLRKKWFVHNVTFSGKENPVLHPPDLVARQWARFINSGKHTDISAKLEPKIHHFHMGSDEIREHVANLEDVLEAKIRRERWKRRQRKKKGGR